VTALDLDDELRRRSPRVARASVYRALGQREQRDLVRRIEVARGVAGYERVDPTGHHHHHAICRDCGRMVPFEDHSLERAIGRLCEDLDFDVTEHDVVLRGRCERCAN
jgi:Fur family ferric uptake transcriptional regulator